MADANIYGGAAGSIEDGHHIIEVRDRGGKEVLFQFRPQSVSSLSWGRVRDDTSEATVQIEARQDDALADKLASVQPMRHEMCIWRDGKRQWEGPLTALTYTRTGVSFTAKDVSYYLFRLVLSQVYDNSTVNGVVHTDYVTSRIMKIMQFELARKDTEEAALGLPSVNVLPYLVEHHLSTDAKTSAKTLYAQYTVWEHLDNLAHQSGIDYTTLGRAIHLWDTSVPAFGQTQRATESDFIGDLAVSVYGSELATRAYATDGQGNAGVVGGADPYYGLVEILDTAYDEQTDPTVPSVPELTSQALRNLGGRNPVPIQVRVPDNSDVSRNGAFTIDKLVPGVYIPLQATVGMKKVSQMQKLTSMKVTEDGRNGESVSVVLYPASAPDDTTGGL